MPAWIPIFRASQWGGNFARICSPRVSPGSFPWPRFQAPSGSGPPTTRHDFPAGGPPKCRALPGTKDDGELLLHQHSEIAGERIHEHLRLLPRTHRLLDARHRLAQWLDSDHARDRRFNHRLRIQDRITSSTAANGCSPHPCESCHRRKRGGRCRAKAARQCRATDPDWVPCVAHHSAIETASTRSS
jgi:hypothetical protein